MDPIDSDDLAAMRNTPPAQKAKQALEAMRLGIRLKRASLKVRYRAATDVEIEAMLQAWLDEADD